VKCSNCDFIYVNNLKSNFYKSLYKYIDYKNNGVDENRIRSDAKRSLKLISKYVLTNSSVLDIGCGRGYLLDEAKIYNWRLEGFDYSLTCVKYAKNKLNLNVTNGDINKDIYRRKYDLIILNQVLEHLDNPIGVLKRCNLLLKKNGIIYIATPNVNSWLAKVYQKKYEYFIPPEHIGYYDQYSLKNVLLKTNFKILFKSTWSYRENFSGIIKELIQILKLKSKVPSRSFDNIIIQKGNVYKQNGLLKKIKYFIFDIVLSTIFYRFLNLSYKGTNIEVIAKKL
jgi:2-polyprenyl-3-methyl-5-hydroxy-6-metoxy-1,4-benzoquinol methylase